MKRLLEEAHTQIVRSLAPLPIAVLSTLLFALLFVSAPLCIAQAPDCTATVKITSVGVQKF